MAKHKITWETDDGYVGSRTHSFWIDSDEFDPDATLDDVIAQIVEEVNASFRAIVSPYCSRLEKTAEEIYAELQKDKEEDK